MFAAGRTGETKLNDDLGVKGRRCLGVEGGFGKLGYFAVAGFPEDDLHGLCPLSSMVRVALLSIIGDDR